MDAKLLTESGLKAILSKHKIKDNGLQRALAAYDKLKDDEHDACLEQLAQITKLATALKKAREVAENKAVVDYLNDVLDAKDDEEKDVEKDKEAAAKTDAANKNAQKKKDENKNDNEEEDEDEDEEDGPSEEEEGDYSSQLVTAFAKTKSLNGSPLSFILCDARPFPAIMVAKRISSKHRKQLTEITGGSKKFLHIGSIHFEDGKFVITTDQQVPGLARRVQASVKNYVGKKYRFAHGGETTDDGEDGGTSENSDSPDNSNDTDSDSNDNTNTAQARSDAGASAGGGGPGPQTTPPSGGESGGAAEKDPAAAAGEKAGEPAEDGAPKGPFSIKGAVGRGAKNAAEDVKAVQVALNKQAKAGLKVDGECGPKTIAAIMAFQQTLGQAKPDGLVSPGRGTARGLAGLVKPGPPATPPNPVAPPILGKAELAKAAAVWHSTRDVLQKNIAELQKAVKGHYAAEHPDLLKQIHQGLGKLDVILNTLDTKLADSLGKAVASVGDGARNTELQNCKSILTEHIKYVKSEPLIAHIDQNPFGVETNIKKVLTDALTHMAQSIVQPPKAQAVH
ncbi:MAG: peptidoglycan-binding protein [Chthoniobacter sp.]